MQAVIDPLPLASVAEQPGMTQLGQVPRNLRLAKAKGSGELTDTQLAFMGNQQCDTRAGVVGERLEDIDGVLKIGHGAGEAWIKELRRYGISNIR